MAQAPKTPKPPRGGIGFHYVKELPRIDTPARRHKGKMVPGPTIRHSLYEAVAYSRYDGKAIREATAKRGISPKSFRRAQAATAAAQPLAA